MLINKQLEALHYLEDQTTTELYYGGAVGGLKSTTGCFWQLKRRLKYPGTRGLLGRAVLKTLKETTLKTFFEVAKRQGIIRGKHFELTNAQHSESPNALIFYNGSLIYLKDLFAYPTDPEFDELGSLEITDAFIDEAPQVTEKAKTIVRSRIRFRLDDYNLVPKMMLSGNPSKNWPYDQFYRPFRDGELRYDRKFIQSLPTDNPWLPKSYIHSLEGLPESSRQRLLYGNWEYDDDPSVLINYDRIIDAFSNRFVNPGKKYITADIARFGSDKTVIGVWTGWRVKLYEFSKLSVTESAAKIQEYQLASNIPTSQVVVDEDGVGGGVKDILACKGFVNNSRPFPNPITRVDDNFNNLKSQCYFRIADRFNRAELFIECQHNEQRNGLIKDLENVKQWKMDFDGKRQVMPKDKVKEIIGRSPDYSDCIMMREYFELIPQINWMPE